MATEHREGSAPPGLGGRRRSGREVVEKWSRSGGQTCPWAGNSRFPLSRAAPARAASGREKWSRNPAGPHPPFDLSRSARSVVLFGPFRWFTFGRILAHGLRLASPRAALAWHRNSAGIRCGWRSGRPGSFRVIGMPTHRVAVGCTVRRRTPAGRNPRRGRCDAGFPGGRCSRVAGVVATMAIALHGGGRVCNLRDAPPRPHPTAGEPPTPSRAGSAHPAEVTPIQGQVCRRPVLRVAVGGWPSCPVRVVGGPGRAWGARTPVGPGAGTLANR